MKHAGPPPPPAAATVFGDRLDTARAYVGLLATAGMERGLLGPREIDRLWERHVLNSAAVAELLEPGETVVDVGSGAGLPGIPLAIVRPDLRVWLIEPMQRRCDFLTAAVDHLGIAATVIRGRAEDVAVRRAVAAATGVGADAAVSRAVAGLDKLARWCLPLLRTDGRMLALKGDRAAEEVAECGGALRGLGATGVRVVRCGAGYLDPPTTVVVARRGQGRPARQRSGSAKRRQG